MRILTCIGDATSMHAHGGLPYHLLDAGKRVGFLDAGWPLQPGNLRKRRLLWNAKQLLTRGEYGGYQYAESFLRALSRQAPPALSQPDEIVSIFPLLPPGPSQHAQVSMYIDATLKENFEDYGIDKAIGRSTMADALRRERQAYRDAVRILCLSKSAARVVVQSYGIDARKVHIVPGGANIIGEPGTSSHNGADGRLSPVRLGFIGKDWRRKNLPFVLKIADVLNDRGIPAHVFAAGFDPAAGPKHPRLQAIGFLDKRSEMKTFVDSLRSCHFSCLFSVAEAFGLSNRESLRLGVPVLASNVGGIPDTVPDGCGHLFAQDADAADVADIIAAYTRNPDRYWLLRNAVARRTDEFTWAAAVEKMQAIWAGSTAYCYQQAVAAHG